MREQRERPEVTGSVLVVGGGIAGMQASLDLANAGYLVHLVTESPSIGGKMAQLDKTFPTNECAMCLLGPRMTDTLNHPNIRLYTCSSLEKVEGEKGNFRVGIRQRPRYINLDECTACGDCEQVCPVRVPNEFNQGRGERKAVYKLFPQAVPNKYLIEKRGIPPCRSTCPAGTNAQGYVALISQGKFAEALEVVRRRMPFAGICGRICHHPCETECNRGQYDEPVAIAWLKRAAYDYGWEEAQEKEKETYRPRQVRPEKVAIVGAGPAGLTAAQDLALEGYQVTVYDALASPGGMLRAGIPRYRLPLEVVERETQRILNLGIRFVPNTRLGEDITLEELRSQYQAVILAVGLQKSRLLNIPGAELKGILPGLDFLRQVAQGEKVEVGRRVVVIGGGNVAMDVARTARRLGAEEVHVACLESRKEMPAHSWEIEEALEEGIILHNSWGPKRFLGEGEVKSIELMQCTRVFDEEGRFNPQYNPEVTTTIPADTVIVAIGQAADLSFLGEQSSIRTAKGLIAVDPVTLATDVPGVFACGDVVRGPSSVVEAVASGHEVAETVKRYLNGQDLAEGRETPRQEKLGPPENIIPFPARRLRQRMTPPEERVRDFREVYLGYTPEMAQEEARRCLNCGICSECLQCEAVCQKKAVEHWQKEKYEELTVGSIILAPGYELFDASLAGEYGYGYYDNVITSMEFERFLSSTGPTQGHVERPSDGKVPERIAFIQCVGSRDCEGEGSPYCSGICCMYSTKEAIIAREHDSRIKPTIFYLDMRSYGKNFDKYVEAAKQAGVRYVRAMISRVEEDPLTKNLIIQYFNGEKIIREEFELVVLALGVRPPKEATKLAEICGIELNPYGFAKTPEWQPVATTREGIYVAGAFQGPRDIPETVVNASAAAACAGRDLAPARNTLVRPKEYPPERDVSLEEPRVGVFICHCGINIAGVVDVPAVVEFARQLPHVVYAENNLYTCSQDTLKKIKEIIQEHRLNRVVVASCTIRTHQPLFRETLREAGLNPFYFEMANIRDQCSWVHRQEPDMATEKAKDLVRMAVAKVIKHEALHLQPVPVVRRALIVGGGVAGLTAALTIADQGYDVYVVEKEEELGGYARYLRFTLEGSDVQSFLKDLISQVRAHPRIQVYTSAQVEEFGGHQGHFLTTISQGAPGREHIRRTIKLEHGVIIIATGIKEASTSEYGLGQDPRVITNTHLEQELAEGRFNVQANKQVVFIQCVGSREGERLYCSRTCCGQSLKNALKIKELNPEAKVYILYRDMRTYGFMEDYYRKAREMGVIFIQYDLTAKPVIRQREIGLLEIEVKDPSSGKTLVLWPDQVVLATGAVAPEGIERLATLFKLPLNEDGFFVETHAKLAPIDFPSAGIFLCGAAHSPKSLAEAIAQAQGAAARACTILAKEHLLVGGVVAVVDETKCAACLTCVRVCPYSVPRINERNVAEINAVQCQGCGTCAGECPAKAIQLQHYKDEQLLAKVAGLFREV
ncbi:NADPH-dependent glutamate synthase beta chain [Thermanaeromonas toyohensis ToBE]|uniref:NADPH-dependent glutamate synthase beta chain n=1 Tax=Thermanaeromonas toyohensis ToBE TaxID=698762 RepID=A0A1W1VXI8_9FIRM|nr:FAD-dependent oxidoreductase [Thermanaeromonas toyohensis]SMB98087.1 NADPH-dependent glutamate synthase beta chain [Thermanaeromonas toyohensis ToBE]